MNKIEFGDCRETMRRWAADGVRVQTCVTSPPYFGLRRVNASLGRLVRSGLLERVPGPTCYMYRSKQARFA